VPGLPATGEPFRIRGCGVGRIRDGRIAEVTEYRNMAEFLIQVGILPPPGA
jgi:ketosteroid isomerase-like protein